MAKSDGEENKGKALYIETRVDEMKKEIREEIKKKKAEEKEAKIKATESEEITQEEKSGLVILLIVAVITFAIAFFSDIFK
jgi:cell division protein FtsL